MKLRQLYPTVLYNERELGLLKVYSVLNDCEMNREPMTGSGWSSIILKVGIGCPPIDMKKLSEVLFKEMGTTLQAMNELNCRAQIRTVNAVAKTFFPESQDFLAFELKSPTKTKSFCSNWFSNKFALLETSGIDDKPCEVSCYSLDRIMLRWGAKYKLDRDISLGPAMVEMRADGFTGYHFRNGERVQGHKDWRTRCAAHNPWMKLYDE